MILVLRNHKNLAYDTNRNLAGQACAQTVQDTNRDLHPLEGMWNLQLNQDTVLKHMIPHCAKNLQ